MLVATGCGMVDMVLAMAGRTSWNLVNVLVALGVTIGLDTWLIPRYGALGESVGLASAMVANNLLPLIQIGRVARLHPFGRGTRVAALLSLIAFGAVPWTVTALAGRGPAGLTLAVVLGVPVFAGGAWLLRGPLALSAFRLRSSKGDH
jgi:O-antigen/teichoic acid export membrane protein